MQLVTADPDAARCPDCGERSTSGTEWTLTRPWDLLDGGTGLLLQWCKRRWRCHTEHCPRQTFTEQVPAVPACADHGPAARGVNSFSTPTTLRFAIGASRASAIAARSASMNGAGPFIKLGVCSCR